MGIGRPDPKGFQLKSVEGDANIVREEHYHQSSERREVDYELHIGGVTFDVDSGLADIIMQGDTCAVYYIEGTKEIVYRRDSRTRQEEQRILNDPGRAPALRLMFCQAFRSLLVISLALD